MSRERDTTANSNIELPRWNMSTKPIRRQPARRNVVDHSKTSTAKEEVRPGPAHHSQTNVSKPQQSNAAMLRSPDAFELAAARGSIDPYDNYLQQPSFHTDETRATPVVPNWLESQCTTAGLESDTEAQLHDLRLRLAATRNLLQSQKASMMPELRRRVERGGAATTRSPRYVFQDSVFHEQSLIATKLVSDDWKPPTLNIEFPWERDQAPPPVGSSAAHFEARDDEGIDNRARDGGLNLQRLGAQRRVHYSEGTRDMDNSVSDEVPFLQTRQLHPTATKSPTSSKSNGNRKATFHADSYAKSIIGRGATKPVQETVHYSSGLLSPTRDDGNASLEVYDVSTPQPSLAQAADNGFGQQRLRGGEMGNGTVLSPQDEVTEPLPSTTEEMHLNRNDGASRRGGMKRSVSAILEEINFKNCSGLHDDGKGNSTASFHALRPITIDQLMNLYS